MTKTDAITREITVSAPIEKVWKAITVADQLAGWFGDSAEVDLRPGGAMRIGWSEYDATADCVIEVVDEPHIFAFRWESAAHDDGGSWHTTVTFTLDESDGMTTIKVVESGLAALPDDLHSKTLEENSSGWTAELEDLRVYLKR